MIPPDLSLPFVSHNKSKNKPGDSNELGFPSIPLHSRADDSNLNIPDNNYIHSKNNMQGNLDDLALSNNNNIGYT